MDKKFEDFTVDDVKKLAQSPAGQQLFALLRNSDAETIRQTQAGNYEEAAKRLKAFLATPQARQLLKELGR